MPGCETPGPTGKTLAELLEEFEFWVQVRDRVVTDPTLNNGFMVASLEAKVEQLAGRLVPFLGRPEEAYRGSGVIHRWHLVSLGREYTRPGRLTLNKFPVTDATAVTVPAQGG